MLRKTFSLTTIALYAILTVCCSGMSISVDSDPDANTPPGGNDTPDEEIVIDFQPKTFTNGSTTVAYRRAEIGLKEGVNPVIILYLHGGSSKGNDNEKHMGEPGIMSIAEYLKEQHISSIFLVPQCPKETKGWPLIAKTLVSLIGQDRTANNKVYIFGGSMGGTGTWYMLSTHPELFTAAMPVAGNPTSYDAAVIAKTPFYAVQGSADAIMGPKIVDMQGYLEKVDAANGKYKFDTVEGWDHETVCKQSYVKDRLDWIFSF